MKLVRYDRNGAVRLGALDDANVVDLLDACPVGTKTESLSASSDMTLLIAAGEAGLKVVRAALASARMSGVGRMPAGKVKLAAPLIPTLLLCSGENYWDHHHAQAGRRDFDRHAGRHSVGHRSGTGRKEADAQRRGRP